MNRWIDLDELRRDIAAEAKARAVAAGLDGVKVRVQIAQPDKHGARVVDVEVAHASPQPWSPGTAIVVDITHAGRCYDTPSTALIKAPR